MARGSLSGVGTGYSVTLPVTVIRRDPARRVFAEPQVAIPHHDRQRPATGAEPVGKLRDHAGRGDRPIRLTWASENHRFPSGPDMMPSGPAPAVGSANSVIAPRGVIRAICVGGVLAEPQISVGPRDDPDRPAVPPSARKLGEGAAVRIEPPDLGGALSQKPQKTRPGRPSRCRAWRRAWGSDAARSPHPG